MQKGDKKKDKKQYTKIKQEEWIEMDTLNFSGKSDKKQQKNILQYPKIRETEQKQNKIQTINQKFNNLEIKQNNVQNKKRNPTIPMMDVICDHCTVNQRVPANTQVYTCGSCENMNQCYPLYGIFICGCCKSKVYFGFGINHLIKCPKCKSVNKVPLQPQKKYQALPKKQEMIKTKQQVNFFQQKSELPSRQTLQKQKQDQFYKFPGVQ